MSKNKTKIITFKTNLLIFRTKKDFLLKTLKLTGTISMTNIVLFDKDGKLRRYNGPDEIVDEFFGLKLEFLQKRKDHIIKTMELEMKMFFFNFYFQSK